jgi:hypothetical protein
LEEKCLQQQEELDTINEEKKQFTESKKKLQNELNTKVAEVLIINGDDSNFDLLLF